MLGHPRRRPTLRSSTTPICPTGGDATISLSLLLQDTKHRVRRRFANSTRRARHKRCRIYVPVYLARISHTRSSREAESAVLVRLATEAPAVVLVQYVEETEGA